MFRDGIFENFTDFLNKINESTLKEDISTLASQLADELRDYGYKTDEDTVRSLEEDLSQMSEEQLREINDSIRFPFNIEEFKRMFPNFELGELERETDEYGDPVESKIAEGLGGIARYIQDFLADRDYEVDSEEFEEFLSNLSQEDREYLEDAISRGDEEAVMSVIQKMDVRTVESKLEEDIGIGDEVEILDSPGKRKHGQEGHVGKIGRVSSIKGEEVWVSIDSAASDVKTGMGYEVPTANVLKSDVKLVRKSDESKTNEDTRKEAEQTMQPQEEQPKEDAERLSMEDWSEEDKDGKPKRKDDVEYPSKLREPEEKEFEQEVKYERRMDPLYLCNECFKTFRANKPICKCGSAVVERILKEQADSCRKCGRQSVVRDGLCMKCLEEEEKRRERERDSRYESKVQEEKVRFSTTKTQTGSDTWTAMKKELNSLGINWEKDLTTGDQEEIALTVSGGQANKFQKVADDYNSGFKRKPREKFAGESKVQETEEEDVQTKVLFAYDAAREKGKSREEAVQMAVKASKGQMTAPEVRTLLGTKSVDTAEIPERPEESKVQVNEQEEVSIKDIYDIEIESGKSPREAAWAALDLATVGTFSALEGQAQEDAINKFLKTIGEVPEESKVQEQNKPAWSRKQVEEELLNPLADGIQAIGKNYYYASQTENKDGHLIYEYYSPDAPKIEVHVIPYDFGLEEEKVEESEVPFYKSVFAVQYTINGTDEEDRVEAHDEEDAKKMVLKKKPEAKDLKAKKIGESKVNETVQELVGEIPGINRHDQEILNWAVENNTIQNEWPSEDIMIDLLSKEEKADFGMTEEDPEGVDLGDLKSIYLKYVLLPKAKEEYAKQEVPEESKLKEQDENGYRTVANGFSNRDEAEEVAKEHDGQVISDPDENDKFAVIVRDK